MTAVRLRQARLLLGPLWRARAWTPVVPSVLVVLAVAAAVRARGGAIDPDAVGAAGAMLLAAAAAFAADDDSAAVVAPSPAPLAFRCGIRLGGAALLAGVCWAALLSYVAAVSPGAAVARPTLVAATLLAVALLAGHVWGGVAGGPAVAAFVLGAVSIPDRWSPLAPGHAGAARLAAVLAIACAVLAGRLRDPFVARHRP